MRENILAHIAKFVSLDQSETDLLLSALSFEKFKKKAHVLEAGKNADRHYYVAKGCLRLYIINDKGNEQTLQFAIENWWIADYLGFNNNAPSAFFIQAVENSEVVVFDKNSMEITLSKVPKLERYFRLTHQKSLGAAQMRINYLFTQSAEERYHHFNNQFPGFVQRVPQYMLASYLDFSAEFLSKIRAGKI